MKKNIFTIIILSLLICLCFMQVNVLAVSTSATLTADGTLVGTYASVQEAVDAITITAGSNFIIEISGGTVSDPLNILQQTNKNVVIRPQSGASVIFSNTITIDGNGNLNNPETLLIQGLTFDFSSGSPENCIYFNLIPPRAGHSYAHNVTINGCSFNGVLDTTVAVQSIPGGLKNVSIMNSTATDMHSLAQLKAVSGYAFIQNCIVSNSTHGVNFYGPGALVIDSCNFNVVGYAVRSGQSSGTISNVGSVTINNSILTSNSTEDGTIVLRGDSTNNINIVHSNITNANSDGATIQNLNLASEGLYKINIVESDLIGNIIGISLATITTIDDPNVQNGPIFINNDSDNTFLIAIIIGLTIILLMLICAYVICLFSKSRKCNNRCC
jgi:hypothetical protein